MLSFIPSLLRVTGGTSGTRHAGAKLCWQSSQQGCPSRRMSRVVIISRRCPILSSKLVAQSNASSNGHMHQMPHLLIHQSHLPRACAMALAVRTCHARRHRLRGHASKAHPTSSHHKLTSHAQLTCSPHTVSSLMRRAGRSSSSAAFFGGGGGAFDTVSIGRLPPHGEMGPPGADRGPTRGVPGVGLYQDYGHAFGSGARRQRARVACRGYSWRRWRPGRCRGPRAPLG